MSLSENEKENSGSVFSERHNERKFALLQGLSHPKSKVNRHGFVKFTEDFVSFAAVLNFHLKALQGTCLEGLEEAHKRDIKRLYGVSECADEHVCDDEPAICEAEISTEFPTTGVGPHLVAMKHAILAGFTDERSFINLWHFDCSYKKTVLSPVLLYLHRDGLKGTTLEKPGFLPNHKLEAFVECRNRTPNEDFKMMVDDLIHFRFCF